MPSGNKFIDFCSKVNIFLEGRTWGVMLMILAIIALFIASAILEVPAPIDSELSKVMK